MEIDKKIAKVELDYKVLFDGSPDQHLNGDNCVYVRQASRQVAI